MNLKNRFNVLRCFSIELPRRIFSTGLSMLLLQASSDTKTFSVISLRRVSVDQRITLRREGERMVLLFRFGNTCPRSYEMARANAVTAVSTSASFTNGLSNLRSVLATLMAASANANLPVTGSRFHLQFIYI